MSGRKNTWRWVITVVHSLILAAILVAASTALTVYLIGTLQETELAHSGEENSDEENSGGRGPLGKFEDLLSAEHQEVRRYLGEWEFVEPHIPGHFHHVGRWYEADSKSFCVECHGPLPHSVNEVQRAFLNMHAFFTACETCHIVDVDGKRPDRFGWKHLSDSGLGSNPEMTGSWGEYGARIVPLEGEGDDLRPILLAEEETLARTLEEPLEELSEERQAAINEFLHRRCAETKITCGDCHRNEDPMLPLRDLGFSEERVTFLAGVEVTEMIRSYELFHLPTILKSGGRRVREASSGDEAQEGPPETPKDVAETEEAELEQAESADSEGDAPTGGR